MKKLILTALTVLTLSTGVVAPVAAASGEPAPQPSAITTATPTPDEAKKIFIGGLSATGDNNAADAPSTPQSPSLTTEEPTPDEAKKIFIGGLSATGDSTGDGVTTGRDDVITREDKDRG